MQETVRQVVAELKGSWRFRWIAVAAAWIVCLFGWLVVYALPDSYESEATVYVDTVSALRPLLEKMTVGSDVLSRVELVTRDTDDPFFNVSGSPVKALEILGGLRIAIGNHAMFKAEYRYESEEDVGTFAAQTAFGF